MRITILKQRFTVAVLAAWFSAMSAQAGAASLDIADEPLFLVSIPPMVMVMLDNSGSMKIPMYTGSFNNANSYHGMFEASKNYIYNPSIPVNTAAYLPVTVKSSATGAFVESTCTPSSSNATCWSGNFLNWLMTRRIDSSRVVLVGGKLESETAFNYGTDYAGNTLQYKLVGNNEYDDDSGGAAISKSYGSSSSYSPVPDGQTVNVYSTPDANGGAVQASYDPYAKFTAGGSSGIIYNSAGTAIGEFGTVSADHTETTISLVNTYSTPVAVAGPASISGGQPGVVTITQYSSTQLKLKFREWEYLDGSHVVETMPYVVIESGEHTLPGGKKLRAGRVSTKKMYAGASSCGSSKSDSESVSFSGTFSSAPVVIHGLMSDNDSDPVSSRVWDIDSSGMKLALQEEEKNVGGGHGNNETVGYIAVNAGTVSDTANSWSMEIGSKTNVDHNSTTITYSSSFGGAPSTLAAIQTMSGSDPSGLRVDSTSGSNIKLHVSEEESCDSETNHVGETVGYMAFYGTGSYNVALVVPNKPSGLLQSIDGKVRLGVSFYRYNPNSSNIYNGETTDGGTLKFKIPLNPFVKKPTDNSLGASEKGYRELSGYIGTDIEDISDAIQHYPLVWGTTPIAENLWEVIQYFEQDSPYYSPVVSGFPDFELADTDGDGTYEVAERDPFYYSDYNYALQCASPSVIIFTDGEPYKDSAIPATIVDYDGDGASKDHTDSDPDDLNGHDNLDDVAFWGFCDKSASGSCPDSDGDGNIDSDDDGNRDLRSDLSGQQFLRAYTVGFAGGSIAQILQDTSDNAGGQAYAAEDGASLESALTQAFTDAVAASSAAAVSVSTGSITSGTKLYYALFDGTNWTGDVVAYSINMDGTVAGTPTWKATNMLPGHASRNIFTFDGSTGVAFTWAGISSAQRALLNNDSTLLDYLRGDKSNEGGSTGFRVRSKLLGDIVHSSPQFIGPPGEQRYPDNWNGLIDEPEDSVTYSSFAAGAYKTRASVVYSGGNDGMLHAFHAGTGTELFGYVPNELFSNLEHLASTSYSHRYYVDGTPTIQDAFYDGAWHTVLVGGYGAGGQGIYALDVTDPANFTAGKVLWEFSDDNDADMGFSYSRPNIVRMQAGSASSKWAAVFGNGFDNIQPDGTVSSTGTAVLYILDISDGSLVKKIDTGVGSASDPNGLATVAPVDVNGDYIVDYIYGGDLYGNLWKFDVSSNNTASWGVAFSGNPLFTACYGSTCSTSNRQPITTRPRVAHHPKGAGYMVYFGTGKYFEVGDDAPTGVTTQSFYGVWDRGASHQAFDRDHMLQQTVIEEQTYTGSSGTAGYDYRIVSDNEINWHVSTSTLPSGSPPTSHLGWYLDLYNTESGNTTNYGEKQVSDPVLRSDKIIFTTLIPSADPCAAGGSSWLMELSTVNGGRLAYPLYDVDSDGDFTNSDYLSVTIGGKIVKISPSGRKANADSDETGIISTPGIVSDPVKGNELKINVTTGGELLLTLENPGPGENNRQSWRQLR